MPQGGELITSQKQSKGYYLILLIILYTYAFKYFLSFGPNFLQQYIKFKTSFTLQVIRYLKIPPFSHLWDRRGRFHKWHFFHVQHNHYPSYSLHTLQFFHMCHRHGNVLLGALFTLLPKRSQRQPPAVSSFRIKINCRTKT